MTTGTKANPTPAQAAEQSIIIVRDFTPGQIVRVIFMTPEQAKQLPLIPPTALQIAIAPAGGLSS